MGGRQLEPNAQGTGDISLAGRVQGLEEAPVRIRLGAVALGLEPQVDVPLDLARLYPRVVRGPVRDAVVRARAMSVKTSCTSRRLSTRSS